MKYSFSLSKLKRNDVDIDIIKAVLIVSFVLVFPKKWEPGGNIDTIWYSAIARNIAESHNYFHFYISKFYMSDLHDHMPLTYWITGGIFQLLGINDFTARLYPMICSFASYLFVFVIGKRTRDRSFGLGAVVMYALCFGSTKWNGSLLHDVPLTTCFLACTYFLIRAVQGSGAWLIPCGVFFALGILTKGPIILGFIAGAFLWALWERRWRFLFSPWVLSGLAAAALILGLLFLPPFLFDGKNYYGIFYQEKIGYTKNLAPDLASYFSYVWLLISLSPISAVSVLFFRPRSLNATERSLARLFFCVLMATLLPLSVFQIKFPHYILPLYPYLALLGTFAVHRFCKLPGFPGFIKGVSLLAIFLLVSLPIKVTGKRSKDLLNLVDTVKLDSDIKNKGVFFRGDYWEDMGIYQHFKFYGGLDLQYADPAHLDNVDLSQDYLITKVAHLPLSVRGKTYDRPQCIFLNSEFCALTETAPRLKLPDFQFPYETY